VAEKELPKKDLIKSLLEKEGEARGVKFKADEHYILEKEGREGLKRVEGWLKEAGVPVEYSKIKALGFYPIGWWAVSELAMESVFGWKDEDFRALGAFAVVDSLIVRLYMKFFHSLEAMLKQSPQIWRKYFTVGELSVLEYDMEKRKATLKISDLSLTPTFCRFMEGYFAQVTEMIVKAKTECRETFCCFKGDPCHEFTITWQGLEAAG
jgi:hypothetical protein